MINYNIAKYIIKDLAKQYEVKVIFKKNMKEVEGLFEAPNTLILDNTAKYILQTFFHELGHYHCYVNNLFAVYHKKNSNSPKNRNTFIRTAFRAEKYVDKWGEKECKKHFPNYKWVKSYRTEEDKEWVKDYYKIV